MKFSTAREFEEFYARNSGATVEELREQGRVVLVCQCGEPGCHGFASMLKDQADLYIEQLPGAYGYRYPEEENHA